MATPPQRASQQARSARFNRRPPSFAITLLALAIIFALAWMFFLRSGPSASAPVVAAAQGTYTWQPGEGSVSQTGRFSAAADGNAGGDMSPDAPTLGMPPAESTYDAATKTETTVAGPGAPRSRRIVGEWPPVWSIATRSPLDYQGLAAVVRTAVEDGDDAVGIKPGKDGDRAVWRASLRLGGEQVDLVVDQKTGLVTWYSSGAGTFTATVDWDSPPPTRTSYDVEVPAGTPAKTVTRDAYVYAGSPAAAGNTAGYIPLVSGLAPDGYALRAVATVEDFARPFGWLTTETVNVRVPPGLRWPMVTQLYTRGLSWFTMEQANPHWVESWGPPMHELAAAASEKLSYQETTLQYGALKGETAMTWYQESGPSLFVLGERRAVFVTGALTRQELIAFAEGLKPVPAAE